jgi:dTDP-4-dehydrorhamnose 3,5-epimerase
MDIHSTPISGLFTIRSRVFTDQRGTFVKTYHANRFAELGLNTTWRERFWSASRAGVIRGLHFQIPPADHAKLVACSTGRILDAVVDLRVGSPSYGCHQTFELSADNGVMVYIPRGMAHGFQSLEDGSVLQYDVETVHDPACDQGIRWDSCGIPWHEKSEPILSVRDASFPSLSEFESPF